MVGWLLQRLSEYRVCQCTYWRHGNERFKDNVYLESNAAFFGDSVWRWSTSLPCAETRKQGRKITPSFFLSVLISSSCLFWLFLLRSSLEFLFRFLFFILFFLFVILSFLLSLFFRTIEESPPTSTLQLENPLENMKYHVRGPSHVSLR